MKSLKMSNISMSTQKPVDFTQKPVDFKAPTEVTEFLETLSDPTDVVVDFDETLLLRNSTEAYLDSLQPRLLGTLFLLLLEKLRLWWWLPKPLRSRESSDWIRIVLATLFFPWTLFIWRRQAKQYVQRQTNWPLLHSLQNNPQARVVVATRGFECIVGPLLAHMPLDVEALIGCRFLKGGSDRQLGKEEMLTRHFSDSAIRQAAVITDSRDDTSLLAIVKYPFLVQWPGAKYIRAMSGAYLPFFYLEKVKKPGQKFLVRVVLKDHLLALLLACTWLSSMPLLHGLGMALLAFSFWGIYEIGYFENDLVAEKYEAKPVLSETYHLYKDRMSIFLPWFVSLFLAVPGVALLQLGNALTWETALDWQAYSQVWQWQPFCIGMGLWTAMLIMTRLLFSLYNYLDEQTRIWLYPLLQFAKYAGFIMLTPISLVGIALLMAQVFVEWIPYMVYRCGGNRALLKEQIFRIFVFLSITLSAAIVQQNFAMLLTAQFFVILGWYLARSLSQVKETMRSAHFIWN